jgi:hypothetical protein
MRAFSVLSIPALLCAAAVACYPDQMDSLTETASVTTLVDSQGVALLDARTFAMPDTIVVVNRGAGVVGHNGDDQILARIRESFISRGWRDVTNLRAEKPDVVVLTAAVEQAHTGVAYGDWWSAWGYWPGWGGSYGSDWAWGYPSGVTFTYESGTLLIVMLDRRHDNTSEKRVPVLWAAGVNAVLATPTFNIDLAIAGVDQAFAQSPYLLRP